MKTVIERPANLASFLPKAPEWAGFGPELARSPAATARRARMDVQSYRGLSALPQPFLGLLDRDGDGDFFHCLDWYRNLERHGMRPGTELQTFAVGAPADPRGLLIGIRPTRPTGLLRASSIHFTHPDLLEFRAHVDPRRSSEAEVVERVVTNLAEGEARVDSLRFGTFDPQDRRLEELRGVLRRRGFFTQSYFVCANWYEEVGGRSAEQYLAARPSRLQNTLRRRAKRLEKEAVGQVHIVSGGEHLTAAAADYIRISAASWQGRNPMPDEYISGFFKLAADRQFLRLGLLYVDGQPAAGQIWLVSQGTASCYRLAYDPRFQRFSVGTLLTGAMVRRVIDVDGAGRIDFGIGDDPYKKDWVDSRREMWGLAGFNRRSLPGLAGAAQHLGAGLAKLALGRGAGPGGETP